MALAVVAIHEIRLSIFVQLAVDDQEPVLVPGRYGQPSVYHFDIDLPAIPDVVGPVVWHVQVQGPVPIDVRQRHGHAPEFAGRSRGLRRIGKSSLPVIQKAVHAAAGRRHQQVRVSVTIDVGKDRPATEWIRANDPGLFCHILEFPAAEIFVEGI